MNDIQTLSLHTLFGMLILGASAGCGGEKKKGPPPKQDFKIEAEVTDDNENPVPEAPVLIDGKRIGYTDRNGELVATLTERPGKKIEIAIAEMEGYHFVSKRKTREKLKVRKSVTGQGRQAVGIPFSVKVSATTQPYLVWVHTECDEDTMDEGDCRGIPVKRDGDVVARTDRMGRAHFSFEEEPKTKVTITIDTPRGPDSASEDEDDEGSDEDDKPVYKPHRPIFELELGLDPKVYLIEQKFDDPTVEETGWTPPSNYEPSASNDSGSGSSTSEGSSGGGGAGLSGASGGDDENKDDEGPIELFE